MSCGMSAFPPIATSAAYRTNSAVAAPHLPSKCFFFWPLEAHGHDKRPRRRWLQTRMPVIAISPPVHVYGVPVMGFCDLR